MKRDIEAASPKPRHGIRSAPFFLEKRPFRSYWEGADSHGIEEVDAALARVRAALRCLGYPWPNYSSVESSTQDVEAFPPSPELLEHLLIFMRREPALSAYLDVHTNELEDGPDLLAAWAAASGDVAYFLSLKEHGWKSSVSRYAEAGKSTILPAIFIVLTAYLGNCIATDLQREAFKHQKTFDVQMTGLQKGQDRAAELYTSINEIYSDIADMEENNFTGIRSDKLRAERHKLDSIHAASKLYDSNDIVGKSMRDAQGILDKYINCLEDKRERETPGNDSEQPVNCSQENKRILSAFDEVLKAHSLAMATLVNSEA